MSIVDNKNKFIWIYLSLGISIFQYCVSQYISWFSTLTWGLLLFIPVICTYLIYFLSSKICIKYPKATKIVSNIINFIIVIIIQFTIIGILSVVVSSFIWVKNSNIRLYNRALSIQGKQERIAHFPQKIPIDRSNAFFHVETHPLFGSGELILSFVASDEYINNEINKFKYQDIEGPFDNFSKYTLSGYAYSPDNDSKYIIKNKNYVINSSGNYAYGILVNKNNNRITYYYFVSD